MKTLHGIKCQAIHYLMRVGMVVSLSTLFLFLSPGRITLASPVALDEVELILPDDTSWR